MSNLPLVIMSLKNGEQSSAGRQRKRRAFGPGPGSDPDVWRDCVLW